MRTLADELKKIEPARVRRARQIAKNRRIKIKDEPCGCTVRFITDAELRKGRLYNGDPIPEKPRMVEVRKGGETSAAITIGVCDWHASRPWWDDEFLKPQRKVEEAARDCRDNRVAQVELVVKRWRGTWRARVGKTVIAESEESRADAVMAAMTRLRSSGRAMNITVAA